MIEWRLVRLSDAYLSLQTEPAISPATNDACLAVAESIEQAGIPGVLDVIPSYSAVGIHFDPLRTDEHGLTSAVEQLASLRSVPEREGRVVHVEVAYGGTEGPDLEAVAAFAGVAPDQVVAMHAAVTYRVYMLGFLPGFPYLGSVDPRIAMPRLERPRARVARGSVGIAGAQTGIYPCESPGGWRIIGRTTAALFDASRSEPFLLRAGDRVKFVAV